MSFRERGARAHEIGSSLLRPAPIPDLPRTRAPTPGRFLQTSHREPLTRHLIPAATSKSLRGRGRSRERERPPPKPPPPRRRPRSLRTALRDFLPQPQRAVPHGFPGLLSLRRPLAATECPESHGGRERNGTARCEASKQNPRTPAQAEGEGNRATMERLRAWKRCLSAGTSPCPGFASATDPQCWLRPPET